MAKKNSFSMTPGKKAPEEFDDFVNPEPAPAKSLPPTGQEAQKDEAKKRITIDMPESMHRRIKLYSVHEGRTMNKILREWIEKNLEDVDF